MNGSPVPSIRAGVSGTANPADPAGPPSTLDALIVDDEPVVRWVTRRALENAGWSVTEAGNGAEALRVLEACEHPDRYGMILTDVRMPVLDGIGFAERVLSAWPLLVGRLVFVSGNTHDADVVRFCSLHGTRTLSKPFSIHSLVALSERVRSRAGEDRLNPAL